MKNQTTSQGLVKDIEKLQNKYGGLKPEYITMHLTNTLTSLTKSLKIFTITLAFLTIVHIAILVYSVIYE